MNYLPEELFQTISKSVPIVCIDVLPVKKVGREWQLGVITRATGQETGKPALIGGRIRHNEAIADAIKRHLQTDLDVADFHFWKGNSASRPFYVQQYLHAATAQPPYGYDPDKHSIGLTYLIEIDEKPQPNNEASAYYWIKFSEVPEPTAYNQHLVMSEAFKFLSSAQD